MRGFGGLRAGLCAGARVAVCRGTFADFGPRGTDRTVRGGGTDPNDRVGLLAIGKAYHSDMAARRVSKAKRSRRAAEARKAGSRKTSKRVARAKRKTSARKKPARKTNARKTSARKTSARKASARKTGSRRTTTRKPAHTTARKAGGLVVPAAAAVDSFGDEPERDDMLDEMEDIPVDIDDLGGEEPFTDDEEDFNS